MIENKEILLELNLQVVQIVKVVQQPAEIIILDSEILVEAFVFARVEDLVKDELKLTLDSGILVEAFVFVRVEDLIIKVQVFDEVQVKVVLGVEV